ncbi:MAG: putative Fe-S cluster assembly protein SufT [Verrucomicrobiales bacterium]|jgi:probable FeS assembly SUF system protein SufT|nr:putative Fe-S cluster assembly protein SufT [Verrucomicrobiales bacterium]
MSSENAITLLRDVSAVQIPNGNKVILKQGSTVILTQSLGGSFTVHVAELGGLYRVAGEDADALGQEKPQEAVAGDHAVLDDKIWGALKTCYDPEIPVNIVDLGLIYSMVVSDLPDGKNKVNVKMTLTAPGCGMGPSIAADAKNKILALKEVGEAEVEVVWEPQWNPNMITKDGKARLGIPD